MIRNVVLVRLGADATPDHVRRVRAGLDGIAALRLPGQVACTVGTDAGLREGGWDAAIVNDWVDAEAYRAYDLDPEHGVYRAMIVEAAEEAAGEVARVQLEVPDVHRPH